jgi:hypothetical protein
MSGVHCTQLHGSADLFCARFAYDTLGDASVTSCSSQLQHSYPLQDVLFDSLISSYTASGHTALQTAKFSYPHYK